jgi:hypothetical protein
MFLADERHADETAATIELLETIDDDLDKNEAHLVPISRNVISSENFSEQIFPCPEVDVRSTIFYNFCQFSTKIWAFFSKINVMIKFLQKLAVV